MYQRTSAGLPIRQAGGVSGGETLRGIDLLKRRLEGATPEGRALLGVLVVAATLRLWDLGAESLWLDELTTMLQTTWSPGRIVAESVARGTPPVYYLLQWALARVLPWSETSLRLLSATVDVISVYLVYAVGRRLVGTRPALLAAALQAVSIRVLWFAQEARAYSLGMMLALLLALTLLRLIERPGWTRGALHAAVAVALIYTHVYSTFALAGIEVAVLLSPRLLARIRRQWLAAGATAVVAYIPWAVALVGQIGARSAKAAAGSWPIAPPKGLATPLVEAIAGFAPGPFARIPASGPSGWSSFVFVALVVFGLLGSMMADRPANEDTPATASEREDRGFALSSWEQRAFLGCWIGVLLFGGIVVSRFVLPIFSWRMAAQAAPVVFLAAANGLRQLWRPAGVALLVAFALLTVGGLRPYYIDEGRGHRAEKEDWRGAIRVIASGGESVDAVVVIPAWVAPRLSTYAERLGTPLPGMTGVGRNVDPVALSDAAKGADSVMLVSTHLRVEEDGLTAAERTLLDQGWKQVAVHDVRDFRLRTFSRE